MNTRQADPPPPRWLDVTYRVGVPVLVVLGFLNLMGFFGDPIVTWSYVNFGLASLLSLVRSLYSKTRARADR